MRYKHIIWDWNGTLLDDTWLCVEGINQALIKRNLTPISEDRYREVFTFPVRDYYKKLGFDLTISLNSAIIPSSVETFDISNLEMITSDSSSISTIFGNSESHELYVDIASDGLRPEISTSFFSPKGIKEKLPLGMVSSPVIQASVGLPLKSEITLRYLPEYSRNNIYFSNYGIGFKHDLLQYLSFLKRIPTLNVSAFAAYSKMNIDYDIQSSGTFSGTNQMANFNISNYKLQILSSVNLSIFEIYSE